MCVCFFFYFFLSVWRSLNIRDFLWQVVVFSLNLSVETNQKIIIELSETVRGRVREDRGSIGRIVFVVCVCVENKNVVKYAS